MTAPAGYLQVWGDEFDGPSLDPAKWWTRYPFSGGTLDYLNDEVERYRESGNHVLANSTLSLTALAVGTGGLTAGLYPSGMIRSVQTFDPAAGSFYVEARAKMPPGIGTWPAFWMSAASDGANVWPPEIDVFEVVNNGVEDNSTMMHSSVKSVWPANPNGVAILETPNYDPRDDFLVTWTGIDLSADFHVYGMLYEANAAVTISFDGTETVKFAYKWVYPDGSPAAPAQIILNLAIGGSWAGRHGIDDAAFPQALQVDYVRLYAKVGLPCLIGQNLLPVG